MLVRQIISLRGWIDGSGWSYSQVYDDQVVEVTDIYKTNWTWWETDEENPPSEGSDTQIIVEFYDANADVDASEPLATHTAWASEIWANRHK